MKRASHHPVFLLLSVCALLLYGCTAARTERGIEMEGGGRAVGEALQDDGVDFLELLRGARRKYEGVNDYTADFTKQQRIGGRLLPEEEIFMKFRKPHEVYMKWTGKVKKGQEVVFAGKKYDDKIIAHKGGILLSRITVKLDPNGSKAMKENLRPITCAGIGFLIHSLLDVSERAEENGDMSLEYHGLVEMPEGDAHKFIRYLAEGEDYPCYRAVICLDEETGFPLLYEAYDRDGNLLERYTYRDVETDEGLDDEDFDRRNDDYRFGIM